MDEDLPGILKCQNSKYLYRIGGLGMTLIPGVTLEEKHSLIRLIVESVATLNALEGDRAQPVSG